MNSYFAYESFHYLLRKYQDVFDILENNGGEFSEEVEIKLKEREDNLEQLAWDVMQIIQNLQSEKKLNTERAKGLENKNKSLENQSEHLKTILQSIVKEKGKTANSGNKNLKLGEKSFTVASKESVELDADFNDEDYIKYELKGKMSPENAKRVATFLSQKGEEAELDKVIMKKEILDDLKAEKIIKGATKKDKDYLIIR